MSKINKNRFGIVYSTNPQYNYQTLQPVHKTTLPPSKQHLLIKSDKKSRNGKEVTLIKGFWGNEKDLEDLAKILKKRCGTGGSAKEDEILIQGDKREMVFDILTQLGYSVKK